MMNVLDVNEITNQFLYGTPSTPPEKASAALIRALGEKGKVTVDINEYMSTVGRFALASESAIVKRLFSLSASDLERLGITEGGQGTPYVFSKKEFADRLGVGSYGINIYQKQWDDGSGDYGARVFMWNSGTFKISDNALFVVEKSSDNTMKCSIQDLRVEPVLRGGALDDFDFVSSDATADAGSDYLRDRIDPSGLGRTVQIFGSGALSSAARTYTYNDYVADLIKTNAWKAADTEVLKLKAFAAMVPICDGLWESQITKFVDSKGRAILYGTDFHDNFDLNSFEPRSSLTLFADTVFDYLADGAVFVAGDGNDTVTMGSGKDKILGGIGGDTIDGGDGDDELYGSSEDLSGDSGVMNTLNGGAGIDKLYGTAGNDVLDGGAGADQMSGGGGDDTYYVDSAGDTVTDSSGASDTVNSSINYTLGSGLENLILLEPPPAPRGGQAPSAAPQAASGGAIMGTGNELDNIITANSLDNRLKGLGGDDWINGGAGDDTAVYRGKESEYDVKYLDNITLVRDSNGGRDGFDVLIDVEHLEFAPEDDEPKKTASQPFRGFAPLFIDPLVLDLDGDGVKLIRLDRSQTHFDFDGNNFRSRHRQLQPRQCRRRRLAGRQRHRLARQLRDEPREVA